MRLRMTLVLRLLFALCAVVAAILVLGSETKKSRMERRKEVFELVAPLVNDPLRELRPLHQRIAAFESGDVVLLDSRRAACVEAAPHVERLAGLSFPPDERGEPIGSAERVRDAAGRFLADIEICRRGVDGGSPGPEAVSTCVLGCMRGWSFLVNAVNRLYADADWVGVRVEAIDPPEEARRPLTPLSAASP